MTVHILKLAVGAESLADMEAWQARQMKMRAALGQPARPACQTRMMPKRGDELLDGGSLYWVVKGMILFRQRILDVAALTDETGRAYCELDLDPARTLVVPTPRKAFQGWRYLKPEEAPADIGGDSGAGAGEMPADLARDLRQAGVW